MQRRHLILAVVTGLTLGACSRGDKLIIGTDATYPPFEFVDPQGQISGVDIEIGKEIGRTLGKEVEFRNINFDGLQTALQTGAVDLLISSVSATPERRKSLDFSDPYLKTGLSVLVAKDSPVTKAEDLYAPGRKVVVRLGTTGETWVRQHLKDAQIKAMDNDPACVMEVVNANVDAWIYDQISVMNHHKEHPHKTRALLAPLREEEWAVALPQGKDDLKAKVNETLARMKTDGSFKRLADRFMAKEQEMMAAQGIPFVFEIK